MKSSPNKYGTQKCFIYVHFAQGPSFKTKFLALLGGKGRDNQNIKKKMLNLYSPSLVCVAFFIFSFLKYFAAIQKRYRAAEQADTKPQYAEPVYVASSSKK